MKEAKEFEWFAWALFYGSPFIIALIVSIIREILDFIFNREKAKELNKIADNYLPEKIQSEISKTLNEWTFKEIEIIQQKRKIEWKEKRSNSKVSANEISLMRDELASKEKYVMNMHLLDKWVNQKTEDESKREIEIHKIFTPE